MTISVQNLSPTITANKLREKLLKEKLLAQRKSSSTQKSPTADEA